MFAINFYSGPIFIIFDKNVAKEIGNTQNLTRLLLIVQRSYSWEPAEVLLVYVAENMVFTVEDRILVENLYKFKGYRAKK